MRKLAILTALFLTFASLYFLYVGVSFTLFPLEIVRPLLLLWTVVILFSWPAYWLTRDWNWAGILLVVLVLGFFSRDLFALAYSVTILSVVGLLWLSYKFLLKRKLNFQHIFLVLNSVTLIAVILLSFVLYSNLGTIPASYYQATSEVVNSKRYVEINPDVSTKPDIYYIILDGYGRNDMLGQLFGIDNSEFTSYLKSKGFIIPERSLTNYPKTALSVASTLNLDYIQNLIPGLDRSIMWWLLSPWLDHNLVRNSLERIGYASVSASTDWAITDNPTTDYYVKSMPIILSEFERYLLGITPLKTITPLIQGFATTPAYQSYRRSQLNNFQSFIRSTNIPGPKFVFGHVLLTHPPFVFLKDGTPITPDYAFSFNDASDFPGTSAEYDRLYAGQLQFANGRLEEVIDAILNSSKEPPIIILQADHGPGILTDFNSIEDTCLPGRFSQFSAYYLPGLDPSKIPDDITPVNLFRVIFNEYFGTTLPLLKNANYWPRYELAIYNLADVTAEVNHMDRCTIK
jgi:hypothetical protein